MRCLKEGSEEKGKYSSGREEGDQTAEHLESGEENAAVQEIRWLELPSEILRYSVSRSSSVETVFKSTKCV